MGDRICVMKDGVIQQVDTPLALYDHPANIFVASFIGTPPMNLFQGKLQLNNDILSFVAETFELPLNIEEQREKLLPHVNQKVVFGIRPEDIDAESTKSDTSAPQITAAVEVVEPMGSETCVYLRIGTESFIAKVDPHKPLTVGEKVALPLNLKKAHIFKQEDGQAVL
jgi:multiple sugar transport system ATP-binding protein